MSTSTITTSTITTSANLVLYRAMLSDVTALSGATIAADDKVSSLLSQGRAALAAYVSGTALVFFRSVIHTGLLDGTFRSIEQKAACKALANTYDQNPNSTIHKNVVRYAGYCHKAMSLDPSLNLFNVQSERALRALSGAPRSVENDDDHSSLLLAIDAQKAAAEVATNAIDHASLVSEELIFFKTLNNQQADDMARLKDGIKGRDQKIEALDTARIAADNMATIATLAREDAAAMLDFAKGLFTPKQKALFAAKFP